MEIIAFNINEESLEKFDKPNRLKTLLDDPNYLVWVDFEATDASETELAKEILTNQFHFHHLTIEDSIETRNQPKIENFGSYLYLIMHGVRNDTNSANFVTKELDIYLGRNYVVTFRKEAFRSIGYVKQHLDAYPTMMRRGTAYLLHQILDHLVDLYMPVIDDFDSAINSMEERVFRMKNGTNAALEEMMSLRRSVARLKRISARQLEVLYRLSHGEFPTIDAATAPFFRDVHDHLLRVSDLSEAYRDLVGGLFEIHFAVVANRTNDVMKILAIFSAIMLPLSLVAGIYGMNFDNMPELHSHYGYFATIGVMIIIAVGLLIYFWRKGWIFTGED